MKPTDDLRVKGYQHLLEPNRLKEELSMSQTAHATVLSGREAIEKIMRRADKRLLVVAGPCSIHDEKAACEYAGRLKELSEKVGDA
ncbi:MAG: 3-deoxy-7-phosphoheptulonate synthase, partial [Desulfobacterales bacterium]